MAGGWHRPITRGQAIAMALFGAFLGLALGLTALITGWGGGVLGFLAPIGVIYGVIESWRLRRRRRQRSA